MRYAWRSAVAFLWRFESVRFAVVWLVRWLPRPLSNWLAVNTPYAVCLRELLLQQGQLDLAAQVTSDLRARGEL